MAGSTAKRQKNINASKYTHGFADKKFDLCGETESGWRACLSGRLVVLKLASGQFLLIDIVNLLKYYSFTFT